MHLCNNVCEECGHLLIDIRCGNAEEVYCPVCDVGDKVEPDGAGDFEICACGCLLASWYLFTKCPACITGEPIPTPVRLADLSPTQVQQREIMYDVLVDMAAVQKQKRRR